MAGAIIGMPFCLEGGPSFAKAIFIGVYRYGPSRLPPLLH
jgi:cytochrome bd-type quinol oxidase subunit 1